MQNEAYVRFVDVQKTYDGDTLVVRDFNLDVARGEFLTLLGPSGSGKTTCLMMLAGFEAATGGEIILDGRPINNVPAYRRDIGVVFQNYALFPHMTVNENLAFPLEVRKASAAEIGARLETGTVFMNRADYLDPALCWTGCKATGRGAALGRLGYLSLTRPKSYHLRRL